MSLFHHTKYPTPFWSNPYFLWITQCHDDLSSRGKHYDDFPRKQWFWKPTSQAPNLFCFTPTPNPTTQDAFSSLSPPTMHRTAKVHTFRLGNGRWQKNEVLESGDDIWALGMGKDQQKERVLLGFIIDIYFLPTFSFFIKTIKLLSHYNRLWFVRFQAENIMTF